MRPREDWNEEVEAHVAASIIVGLVSGALKFGMYLSFPLNIAMVIVGIVHRNDCPVNTRIGWYLVFGGAAGIISVVLKVIMVMAWSCMRKQSEKGLKYDPVAHPALAMVRAVNYLFRLFVIAWNLMATFHIYSVVPDFTDPSSPQYCDETTYTLAYVLVILFDVFFALVIFVWISALLMGLMFPEMVENLYENDCESGSVNSSLPDIELEENSLRQKQKQRRRRRRQKLLQKEVKEPEWPQFDHPVSQQDSDDISSNEGKNILSSVRFSRSVDSRRISKDYYSQLLQQQHQESNSSSIANSQGAKRLKDLFETSPALTEVKEEFA